MEPIDATGGSSPVERLYAIVEQGLCIGCGVCEVVAGPESVRVVPVESGELAPVVVGELDHPTVDTIYDVCPGTRVDGLPDQLVDGAVVDPVWGPWRGMVLAWARRSDVRHEGATGGVLTALARFLITSGRVDFVLHVEPSAEDPTFGSPRLSFTEHDVMAGAGSRYGPTAMLTDLDDALGRDRPFAVVGKPCDLAALGNLARHDERVDRLVRYRLTMVCGGFAPPAFTEQFIRRSGVDPAEVTGFRYRGLGCPGPTRIETVDRTIDRHYLDFWGDDESQWQLPWRCKICPDGIGERADIAAADAWPGGSPDREESATDPGVNSVIVRTAAGQELLDAAVAGGIIDIGTEIGPIDMSRYQPHQVAKKQAVGARFLGLADEGRIVPVTNGLRIDELRAATPVEVGRRQRAGTRERIAVGKATRPTPAPRS